MKIDADSKGFSSLEVMNFLNEIASRFPDAISLASGRPSERFFEGSSWLPALEMFIERFSERNGITPTKGHALLAQYGRTKGIIGDLIALHLQCDECIECASENIIVTSGCQEAIELCVRTLCETENDVVIARTPTYIGITGVCETSRIELASFGAKNESLISGLQRTVADVERRGKRPRLLYLTPEFDNPTGTELSKAERLAIIEFCAAREILVLEDNPYGMFRFEGESNPSMFKLDKDGCVIYLGTFSKTICPSLRVGYVVLPAELFGSAQHSSRICDALLQRKSFVTVNTSQICQAIVGGILLRDGCSLRNSVSAALRFYRENRDEMIACLKREFACYSDLVSWNVPRGGFFLTVRLPFILSQEEALVCARDYGVLAMPLSFFALDDSDDDAVRLAFSYVEKDQIREGIQRFARYVIARIDATSASPLVA